MGRSMYHPVGLIHYAPQSSYRGYTLFCCSGGGDFAVLIDMEGRICHRWQYGGGIGYAYFLPNGNILCKTAPPKDVEGMQGFGGSGASLVELDWNSNVVWEYRNNMIHHDYARLDNGNTLVLLWESMTPEMTAMVKGGYCNDETPEQMFGDVIAEVAPDGSIVRKWNLWEHLDPEEDVICPLERRHEWTHTNSLNLTASGDWLISLRQVDTLAIIDSKTGKLSWKWGKGEVSHTHHASYLDNGNVLVFDNGSHRKGTCYSRVVEVNPETSEIAWEYQGNPPFSFFSYHISGAERLPNGNTLVCEGAGGRLFEVTRMKDIVWEYVNPFFTPDARTGGTSNFMFRAHRYGPEHPAIRDRDLDPARHANYNRLYGG